MPLSPSPSLDPSLALAPQAITTLPPFAALLADSTAPWNDPNDFWSTYNAAIATMFEPIYDIVADQGDVNFTQIATLAASISTAATTDQLLVSSVAEELPAGTEIVVVGAVNWQDFTVLSDTPVGATVIPVQALSPRPIPTTYGVGAAVQLDYVPGWSTLLDPNNCPDQFLPYLAQFNGTDIPVGLDAATARLKILYEAGQTRGTLAAIKAAVTRNLTGTQSVSVLERLDASGASNPYWFIVIVRPEEVPGGNPQPILDAVNAIKPGGVMWSLVQTDTWTISQMELSQPSITALEGNFQTITGLEQDKPGT